MTIQPTVYLDEGYIKYKCHWQKTAPLATEEWQELNKWRNKVYARKWIGYYEAVKVGYGNISRRSQHQPNHFIVTGTQTGHLLQLTAKHYTKVVDFNIRKNKLSCYGPIKASSESLTHAVIYELNPSFQCVIHIHALQMWERLCYQIPTTAATVSYGTPEMAQEIKRLYKEINWQQQEGGIIAMAGHREGLLAFGNSPRTAFDILDRYASS